MKIRWSKENEIEEIILLLKESFPIVTTKEKVAKNLNNKTRILVCEIEEKVVGVILVRTIENFLEDLNNFHLDNVCVKKEFQNIGIASKMLEMIEKIAIDEKIDFIDLTASNYRLAAHHTYLKNGYEKRESCLFRKKISNKEF